MMGQCVWHVISRSCRVLPRCGLKQTRAVHNLTVDHLEGVMREYDASKSDPSRDLHRAAETAQAMLKICSDMAELERMKKDPEMSDLAKEEGVELQSKYSELQLALADALVPHEALDASDAILEVMAGVGGLEAMHFTQEMFQMYLNYAQHKGWETEMHSYEEAEGGGIRHASVGLTGSFVCQHVKFEGGVHRVQRVPRTEKSGRVHTSTMSVAVLPKPTKVQLSVHPKDLKVETKRSSGAGGQHVNTTDSAVRLTHVPTGLVVECQTARSQIRNRELAMEKLHAILFQRETDREADKIRTKRKLQVGSSSRSEKIRTYNFSQDRVTDHRFGLNFHNLPSILGGGSALDNLISQLQDVDREDRLEEILSNLVSNKKT